MKNLSKKYFLAQKEHPTQGDFVKLVQKYLEKLGIPYDETSLESII